MSPTISGHTFTSYLERIMDIKIVKDCVARGETLVAGVVIDCGHEINKALIDMGRAVEYTAELAKSESKPKKAAKSD